MNLLVVDNLRAAYSEGGKESPVLDGLSLVVKRGEWVSIVGPSGCGKTTLLHCIAGLRPFTGDIAISSERPGRADVGYVFQTPRLLNWLTLRENVALVLRARKLDPDAAATAVNQRLAECQIAHLADRYPLFCSEGEKARAAVARAFAMESELLLLDEPFGSLDQITGDVLRNQLRNGCNKREKQCCL